MTIKSVDEVLQSLALNDAWKEDIIDVLDERDEALAQVAQLREALRTAAIVLEARNQNLAASDAWSALAATSSAWLEVRLSEARREQALADRANTVRLLSGEDTPMIGAEVKSAIAERDARVRREALEEAARHLEEPAAATLKRVTDRAMFVLAAHAVRALAGEGKTP